MNIEKAICNLNSMISELEWSGQNIKQQKRIRVETFQTAISAMQVLLQYRQIGTVNEFRTCKEIIGKAEANELAAISDGYLEYSKIGTPEECREAREKQRAKKVTDVHVDEYYCPACGAENNCDQGKIGDKYCPECGQVIIQEENDGEINMGR